MTLSSFVYLFMNMSFVYIKFLTVSPGKNLKNTELEQGDVGIVWIRG